MEQFLVAASGASVFYGQAPNSPYGSFLSPAGLWDFAGSRMPDILAFSWVPQYDGVMLGNGAGTFAPSSPTNALQSGYQVSAVGDFNGDGNLDILSTNANTTVWPPSGAFQLFWGQGNGTFKPGPTIPIPAGFYVVGPPASNGPTSGATYDFNGDGNLDLLAENLTAHPNVIEALLGNGDGTFTPGPTTALPQGFNLTEIADFNGDGKLDLLLTASGNSDSAASVSFQVFLGNGDGTFAPAPGGTISVSPGETYVAVADFNGDGVLDLAVPNGVNGVSTPGGLDTPPLAILLGNGDGTFQRVPNCCGSPGQQAFNMVAADLNNDGKLDLAVSIANNPGTFQPSLLGAFPVYIETFLGNGDGTFQPTNYSMLLPSDTSLSGSNGTMGLYAADVNGDGKLDFVTGDIFGYGSPQYEISVLAQMPSPARLPDFTITASPASVAVKAGSTTTDNIQIASVNGFIGNSVSLAVTGCPAAITCTLAQPQGMLIPSSTGSISLTIATQACSVAEASDPGGGRKWPLQPMAFVLSLAVFGFKRRGRRLPLVLLLPFTVALTTFVGCGDNTSSPLPCTGGTRSGAYTLTVTGTSGSIPHSTSFTLIVE